jgi:hypothetical protein
MPKDLPSRRPEPPAPALEERRAQVITSLGASFAADRLTMEQLEQRVDLAHRALSLDDLDMLVSDLPATAAAPGSVSLADPGAVRERQFLVALMGGVERKGHWVPARKTAVVALMGGAVIDLREAALPPDGIDIEVFTIWGGVEIIVSPHVNIDMGGIAIMGGFSHKRGIEPAPDPAAPTVRVSGLALMAGVDVQVRYAGETPRDARLRTRAERKRLKRGGGDPA